MFASTEAATLDAPSGWRGLRTVLVVETIRHANGTSKVDSELRYLLSSCPTVRPPWVKLCARTGPLRTHYTERST